MGEAQKHYREFKRGGVPLQKKLPLVKGKVIKGMGLKIG
jgi:hypothetical protein